MNVVVYTFEGAVFAQNVVVCTFMGEMLAQNAVDS